MILETDNYRINIEKRNSNLSEISNSQIVENLIKNRNISDENIKNFLSDSNLDTINPYEFSDMEDAVKILVSFIKSKKKIGIYGDFDADGLTGTAILIETIESLGAIPKPFIPNRENEGHGISEKGINSLIDFGCELIITVDTGTNSFDLIEKAMKSNKIEFIITDHHIPEKETYNYPVLNPALNKNLTEYSGAGVAWILAKALFDYFKVPMKEGLTSLATIGTVADVAPLLKNNRTIVKKGLLEISKTNNYAIKALNNISGKKFFYEPPEADYISFSMAPRINTPGRIEDPYTSLKLLTAKNSKNAHNLSSKIEQMNNKRKSLSLELWNKIQNQIITQKSNPLIFIDCTNYPLGLLGPLAGRLVENLSKPVFCFAEKENVYKFSSRSNESYNLFDSLSKLEKYFINFGGHALAAGFSIKSSDYNAFSDEMIKLSKLETKKSKKNYEVDLEVNIDIINYELWDEIKTLSPFGEKNPDPLFYSTNVSTEKIRAIGANKNHISGKIINSKNSFDFIGFNIPYLEEFSKNNVNIIYKLRTDFWNGKKQKKIHILEIDPC
ncbi:MAG: single-stranded-DNA-specific exonuclease RecJ [Dehalococcoidia bacterium]|nr:single-stranded-DNA-specific exonuclease RecJ [Dehalococcoidia bacterium]|tara:strand:- start:22476 stop:24143 length:1668 start_codon:yes stop_codon:yes gene_type:complete